MTKTSQASVRAITATLAFALVAPCAARAAGTALPSGVQRWVGTGVQIYGCKDAAGTFAWTLERPEAKLVDQDGAAMADHGAGPSWTATDGSRVYGTVLTAIPAPAPDAIPWLMLQASRHEGQGSMGAVAYIVRSDTEGGVAPATGCDAGHTGAEIRVPYRAVYTFLSKRPQ